MPVIKDSGIDLMFRNFNVEIASPEPALSDETRLLRFARNDTSEGARNDRL